MTTYYVPYQGDRPAAMSIKGHRLVILSRSRESVEEELDLVGGDRIKKVKSGRTQASQVELFTEIGRSANGGVVLAPGHISLSEVIRNLELELPWLQ